MSDIFISYAREDRAFAQLVAKALEDEGWSVWWDPEIPAGKTFDEVIDQALADARCIVVLWSKAAVTSNWVKEEAEEGRERGILVPAFIEAVTPPRGFRRIHAEDLSGWDGVQTAPAFQRLVSAVLGITGEPSLKPELVESKEGANETKVETGRSHTSMPPGQTGKGEQSSKPEPGQQMTEIFKPGSIFRDTLKDGTRGPEMVVIPAGTFTMGSPETESERLGSEGPQHEVTFAKPFAMGCYAVAFEEYDRFAAATEREMAKDEKNWGRARRPVINVSWDDAKAYADWLNEQTGKKYRLPSEAEWEYAARAGTTTAYWWGDEVGQNHANCDGCGSQWDNKQTAPVGSFEANSFGLHDTSGNVWEWVQDYSHDDYKNAPKDGSAWREADDGDGALRVIRGGSWFLEPRGVRSAFRFRFGADARTSGVGFRLAQDID